MTRSRNDKEYGKDDKEEGWHNGRMTGRTDDRKKGRQEIVMLIFKGTGK